MLVTALDRIYPGWRRPYRWWTPFIGVIEWIMQNITLTSIHSDSTGPTHLSCVRGILFYGLVKHAVAIDLHPRDLLSEKVDRQCLGKVPVLCGFTAEGAQPGGLAGGFD